MNRNISYIHWLFGPYSVSLPNAIFPRSRSLFTLLQTKIKTSFADFKASSFAKTCACAGTIALLVGYLTAGHLAIQVFAAFFLVPTSLYVVPSLSLSLGADLVSMSLRTFRAFCNGVYYMLRGTSLYDTRTDLEFLQSFVSEDQRAPLSQFFEAHCVWKCHRMQAPKPVAGTPKPATGWILHKASLNDISSMLSFTGSCPIPFEISASTAKNGWNAMQFANDKMQKKSFSLDKSIVINLN
ncbi:MAG: hypothetical protein AAGF04_05845 [Chlamydiota bacterium]